MDGMGVGNTPGGAKIEQESPPSVETGAGVGKPPVSNGIEGGQSEATPPERTKSPLEEQEASNLTAETPKTLDETAASDMPSNQLSETPKPAVDGLSSTPQETPKEALAGEPYELEEKVGADNKAMSEAKPPVPAVPETTTPAAPETPVPAEAPVPKPEDGNFPNVVETKSAATNAVPEVVTPDNENETVEAEDSPERMFDEIRVLLDKLHNRMGNKKGPQSPENIGSKSI